MTDRYYQVGDEPPSPTDLYLDHELHQAEAEERNITDTAAKLIAGELHGGQASAFYSLASSGAVDYEGLAAEIHRDIVDPRTPVWMQTWLGHLGTYSVEHSGRGPVPGWHELTRDERIAQLLGEAGIAGAEPSELDTVYIGDRSLRSWHDWLCTDEEMGMPTGHLETPGSRYGSTTEACSWWAIAHQIAYAESGGESDDPEASMDEAMGWAVNNSDELIAPVAGYWYAIPEAVKEHLPDEDEVMGMAL